MMRYKTLIRTAAAIMMASPDVREILQEARERQRAACRERTNAEPHWERNTIDGPDSPVAFLGHVDTIAGERGMPSDVRETIKTWLKKIFE